MLGRLAVFDEVLAATILQDGLLWLLLRYGAEGGLESWLNRLNRSRI